jgi:hypothetical protein
LLHKLLRKEGNSVSTESFRRHTAEEQSSVEMRQLDSGIILQNGRGNKVLPIVLSGVEDNTMEQIQGYCDSSCSHPRECVSRRPVKKSSSGGSDNRVELEAGDYESNLPSELHSEYRPVCNERERGSCQ